jgi:hypothetical protein
LQVATVAGVSMEILETVIGPNPAVPITITAVSDSKLQRQFADIQQLAEKDGDDWAINGSKIWISRIARPTYHRHCRDRYQPWRGRPASGHACR